MQRMSASLAVGLNWPVSIELIVFRETPTSSASCDWERPFSQRASFSRFCSFSSVSFRRLHQPPDKKDQKEQEHDKV